MEKNDLNSEVNPVCVNGMTTFDYSFQITVPCLSSMAALRHMVCPTLHQHVYLHQYAAKFLESKYSKHCSEKFRY